MVLSNDESLMLIHNYPDLARELASMISSAEHEIYIAPRYYEPAIGSIVLAKFAQGVSIHMLDSNPSGVSFEDRLRSASVHDMKNRDLILKFLAEPNSLIRIDRLDYSFVVIDGHSCGVELVNPANPENFFCAMKIESNTLAGELIRMFEDLARSQSKNPIAIESPVAVARQVKE